jgi:DNA-binding NarL/FixJ family response regulator
MVDPVRPAGTPANTPKPAAAPQPVQAKAEIPPKTDSVQISSEAQARSLRQQGMSIPEIALQLRLDVKTVTGYFPQSS